MRRRVPIDQLLYDSEIERTTWRNNNIRRRLFKKALEVSYITVENTTNFSDLAHIQPLDHEEKVDIAVVGEGQFTFRDYATFMGPFNFNNIASLTIVAPAPNMDMKPPLYIWCRVINFMGYLMKTHIITWLRSWKFAT